MAPTAIIHGTFLTTLPLRDHSGTLSGSAHSIPLSMFLQHWTPLSMFLKLWASLGALLSFLFCLRYWCHFLCLLHVSDISGVPFLCRRCVALLLTLSPHCTLSPEFFVHSHISPTIYKWLTLALYLQSISFSWKCRPIYLTGYRIQEFLRTESSYKRPIFS